MDEIKLKYFVSVAQTLNFSEAARRNYISQPAISRHIQDIEHQLGAKLFLRTSHKVQLTSEGKSFLKDALAMLDAMHDAALKVRRISEGKSGWISIGAVASSSFVLQRCLAEFSKRYPDIMVDIDLMKGVELSQSINENVHDFTFTVKEMVPVDADINHIVTHHNTLCLILPKHHPLKDHPIDFGRLSNEPFIIVSPSEAPIVHDMITRICRARGYKPKIINRYNRAESVLLSVSAGVGISILIDDLIKTFLSDDVVSIPIPGEDCILTSVFIWRKHNANTAAAKFLEVVLDLYPQESGRTT